MLLLAILPQLVGHSSYNYALRFLPPTYVAIVSLAEPIGSALLAFVLLHEMPPPLTILGAIVILIGIGVASWPARSRSTVIQHLARLHGVQYFKVHHLISV